MGKMRITIKVHDELKGTEGWSHMFITFNGITKLGEIEEAEINVSMDEQRTIKIQQNVQFHKAKPQIFYKDEGKVQTVKYERTLSVNRLEPVMSYSGSSGNFGNEGSSVFSGNTSSSVTRSAKSDYRRVTLNGQFVKSYHVRGHPFRHYRREQIKEGDPDGYHKKVFFQKKRCLKLEEIMENDPDLYEKLVITAATNGVNVDDLPSEAYQKLAEKVYNGSPTIIVKDGDKLQVMSPVTKRSTSPRSPLEATNDILEVTDQAWIA